MLYTFAEKYRVENLKNLVLIKLHRALLQTSFHSKRSVEFFDILVLAYNSTPALDKEPLRDLLTLFAA